MTKKKRPLPPKPQNLDFVSSAIKTIQSEYPKADIALIVADKSKQNQTIAVIDLTHDVIDLISDTDLKN